MSTAIKVQRIGVSKINNIDFSIYLLVRIFQTTSL